MQKLFLQQMRLTNIFSFNWFKKRAGSVILKVSQRDTTPRVSLLTVVLPLCTGPLTSKFQLVIKAGKIK